MQPRDLDSRVAELAGRQHGVVARRQLVGLGLGEDAVDGWSRRGRLHRLHPGVYAVGHAAITTHGRWMAAVLASGPGAVLSHRSAAALWGIRQPSSGAIEVTVPRKGRSPSAIRRHAGFLPPDEATTVLGIPVTTVPRTIFDLAASGRAEDAEYAMREAEYLRLYDALSLHDLLDRYPGRRGVRRIRTCLARRDEQRGPVRSTLEEVFVPFLRRHRLPPPRLNAWLQLDRRWVRVDCFWEARKVIVELDGFAGHGTRTAFREDRARDRRLRVVGYDVVRIAWSQLEDEAEEIVSDLRDLLR